MAERLKTPFFCIQRAFQISRKNFHVINTLNTRRYMCGDGKVFKRSRSKSKSTCSEYTCCDRKPSRLSCRKSLQCSLKNSKSSRNYYAVSKFRAAGQGFKIINDRQSYFSQILRNWRDLSNPNYHISINNRQAIQRSSIDCKSNAWLTLG